MSADDGRFPPPSPEERLDILEDRLDRPEEQADPGEQRVPEERLDVLAGGPPPPSAEDRAELTRQWPALVPWVVILAVLVVGYAFFLR